MLQKLLQKPITKASLVYIILLVILFNTVFFKGFIFGGGDTTAAKGMTHQLSIYFQEQGEYPLWQPYIFSGMPAFSSLMFTKFVYFPNIVLDLLTAIGIPALWKMLLHYIFAALGVFVLLRYFRIDLIPAILGGAAYMLTPFFVVMITAGHGSQMMTAAYLPWLIFAVIRVFRQPGLASALLLAVIAGLQLQRGHVQVAYYGWMAAGWFVVVELIQRIRSKNWENFLPALGWFTAALLVGIGLAAVLYLPSLSYAEYSIRGGGSGGGLTYDYATSWSFPPAEIISFLISDWFGFGGQEYWGGKPFTEHSDFFGVVWFLLVAAAFLNREHLKIKIFLLSGMLLALLVSFGSYWPWFYDILFNILPYFNKFRVPSMILILMQVLAAILAGFGLQALADASIELRKKWDRTLLIKTCVLVGFLVIAVLFKDGLQNAFGNVVDNAPKAHPALADTRVAMWHKSLLWSLLMGVAITGLIWAWIQEKIPRQIFLLAVAALVVIELGRVDWRFANTAIPASRVKATEQASPAVRQLLQLQKQGSGRVFPAHQLFGNNALALHGLESVGGYSPAKLQVYQDFLEHQSFEQEFLLKYYDQGPNGVSQKSIDEVDSTLRKQHLDALKALQARYLISPYPIPEPKFTALGQFNHIFRGQRMPVVLYRYDEAEKRAWFAELVTGVDGYAAAHMRMGQSGFDIHREAIVTDPEQSVRTGDYSAGDVKISARSLQQMELMTSNREEGFLVLSEIFYPNGWRATLDNGDELKILQTNDILRGMVVPAGDHTITLEYLPTAVRFGFWITLLSTLLCLAAGAWLIWERRGVLKQKE